MKLIYRVASSILETVYKISQNIESPLNTVRLYVALCSFFFLCCVYAQAELPSDQVGHGQKSWEARAGDCKLCGGREPVLLIFFFFLFLLAWYNAWRKEWMFINVLKT